MTAPLLEVTGLSTVFHTEAGAWPAVSELDLHLQPGEILGLVGESGSGKSVTGFSLFGMIEPPGEVVAGQVRLGGQELRGLPPEAMRQLRGNRIAMIFQDPLMTLNPVLRIEEQMREAITEHHALPRTQVRARCIEALEMVGIPAAEQRLRSYPHEFSGGMRQRVAIAMAMLNRPELIICDEPTTALDVTIQGQILYRMQQICREHGTALIWITHDLGVIAELADRVAVMYAGRIVETGSVDAVLDHPRHPYTQGLLRSLPGRTAPGQRLVQIEGMAPSLSARVPGCAFAPRCARASARCAGEQPPVTQASGREFRCFHPLPETAHAQPA